MDTNQTTGTHTALNAAHTQRAETRSKLEAAVAALERARALEASAQSELASAQRAEAAVMAAHAAKLQRSIIDGAVKTPPPLMLDDRPRRTAETRLQIASAALEALQQQHATAQAAVQSADKAVAAEVECILDSEAHSCARRIVKLHATLQLLAERLRGYLPVGMVPISYSRPKFVDDALALVPLPDQLNVPINQMGPRADFETVAARRAELIAGEDAASSDSAAAA
jgi:hypothetical protein